MPIALTFYSLVKQRLTEMHDTNIKFNQHTDHTWVHKLRCLRRLMNLQNIVILSKNSQTIHLKSYWKLKLFTSTHSHTHTPKEIHDKCNIFWKFTPLWIISGLNQKKIRATHTVIHHFNVNCIFLLLLSSLRSEIYYVSFVVVVAAPRTWDLNFNMLLLEKRNVKKTAYRQVSLSFLTFSYMFL